MQKGGRLFGERYNSASIDIGMEEFA